MAESIGRKVWFRRKQVFFRSRPGGQLSITDDTQKEPVKTILDQLSSKEGRIPTRRIENAHTKE
jgi:hypothetical protein